MARKREDGSNGPFQLEWFNVTYRSVLVVVTLVVAVLLGTGSYWYYRYQYTPRATASAAIERADKLLKQLSTAGDIGGLEQTIERASGAFEEARASFSSRRFDDAEFSALQSSDLSERALNMVAGASGSERLARFYRIEGDVRIKKVGEFSWESAGSKMTLTVGDQVKTSSSASAQLIYFDGTVTTIQPGSLLEIRDLYEDPVTKVRRVKEKLNFGEVQASTPESNVKGSFHEVSTEKVSARSEGSGDFSVKYDKDDKTTVVDTFRGQIEVEGGGKRLSAVAGERVRGKSDGQLTSKQALPGVPRLLSPADQRVFIFETPDDQKVSLSWESVAGAKQYHLMISAKNLFTDPLYDAHRGETSAVLDGLDQGSYYWKAAAVSPAGVRGPFSPSRAFVVSSEKIKDRSDTVPPELEITEFVTIGMMVIVNGYSEPGARLWVDNEKIDVYDDGRFYAVVRLRRDGLNALRFRAQDTAGNETSLVRDAYVETY